MYDFIVLFCHMEESNLNSQFCVEPIYKVNVMNEWYLVKYNLKCFIVSLSFANVFFLTLHMDISYVWNWLESYVMQ